MYRVGTAWVTAALPAAPKQRETTRICMKRRYSRGTYKEKTRSVSCRHFARPLPLGVPMRRARHGTSNRRRSVSEMSALFADSRSKFSSSQRQVLVRARSVPKRPKSTTRNGLGGSRYLRSEPESHPDCEMKSN